MSSNNRSLQTRLIRSLLLGCGALFLLVGLVLDRAVVHWLEADFDRTLEAQARALVALSEQTLGEVEFDFVADLMPEFDDEEGPERSEYFQLWIHREDGVAELFERSPSLAGADLGREADLSVASRFRDVELPNGRHGRQVQLDFVPQVEAPDEDDLEGGPGEERDEQTEAEEEGDRGEDEEDGEDDEDEEDPNPPGLTGLDPTDPPPGVRVATLVVARSQDGLAERIATFRSILLGGGLLLLLALALIVHFAVRRGLRPLRDVRATVDALDAGRLDQRIEIEAPAELASLVAKLNELLARLEAAFERERRFSSDVAHELRTPIAELRSLAEVGERWPDDPFAVRRFFGDTRQIAEEMEQVVSQLLAVARTEAGIEVEDPENLHLPTLLAAVTERHRDEAERRGLRLAVDVPPELWLHADPAKLRLVLHNALANAVAYAPEGAEIEIRATRTSDGLVLDLRNPAPGLEAADLEHVFDRFWRKDAARSRTGSSGLGLALVRSLCELTRIDVEAFLDEGRYVLRLRFPREALLEEMEQDGRATA